jgi:hypothetical protein
MEPRDALRRGVQAGFGGVGSVHQAQRWDQCVRCPVLPAGRARYEGPEDPGGISPKKGSPSGNRRGRSTPVSDRRGRRPASPPAKSRLSRCKRRSTFASAISGGQRGSTHQPNEDDRQALPQLSALSNRLLTNGAGLIDYMGSQHRGGHENEAWSNIYVRGSYSLPVVDEYRGR